MTTGSDSSQGQGLTVVPFPDGTGHIGVAAGWTPQYLGQGQAVLVRRDGAQVSMSIGVSVADPNGPIYQWAARTGASPPPGIALPYPPSPAQAFIDVAAEIAKQNGQPDPKTQITESTPIGPQDQPMAGTLVTGTDVIGGTLRRFRTMVHLSPPSAQGWFVSVSALSGPDATFAHDLPTMQAMYDSFVVDTGAQQKQFDKSLADSQAAFDTRTAHYAAQNADMVARSRANATAAQDRMDQSAADFIRSDIGS